MKLRTEIECIIATESSKTHTKIQKQRLEMIVIHYHYGRLVSILHSALAICNAPLVFSHLLLSTEHSLGLCPQAGYLSHSHLKHVSTHFQLPSRGKKKQPNRLLPKSHETHCDLLMTESAATTRTHLTQAQKTKKKKKRTLQSRSC
jgi:hypothetical protein